MNELINKTKTNIEGLNQRFFFVLENFVPNYIRYLENPKDSAASSEINYVNNVITEIESDGFTLKNTMESTIAKDQERLNKLNLEITGLKKENEELKHQEKELKTATVTSVGLFDEELDWYKQQIKLIVIMLIGVIIVGKVYYGLELTNSENIKALGIVVIIGFVFETLIMYMYNKMMYGSGDETTKK